MPDNTCHPETTTPATASGSAAFLRNPWWPEAEWNISGAFRYDPLIFRFRDTFVSSFGTRLFSRVSGAPACSWNAERSGLGVPPLRPDEVARTVQGYRSAGVAVLATFANPALANVHLADPLGNALLEMLAQSNADGRNGVVVGSELLAKYIRRRHPGLVLVAAEPLAARDGSGERLAAYRRLAGLYDLVTLHPEDVLDASLVEALGDRWRYEVIVNDPCRRGCPVRSAHDRLRGEMALAPQDYRLREREAAMLREQGCQDPVEPLLNPARRPLALSSAELRRLYDLGFRSFRMQPVPGQPPFLFQFELARWLLPHDPDLDYLPARLMQCSMV